MCGIFGIVIGEGSRVGPRAIAAALGGLFELSEARGKESAGLAVRVWGHGGTTEAQRHRDRDKGGAPAPARRDRGDTEAPLPYPLPSRERECGAGRPGYSPAESRCHTVVFKQPIPASVMIRSRAYKRLIAEAFGESSLRREYSSSPLLESSATRTLLESSGTRTESSGTQALPESGGSRPLLQSSGTLIGHSRLVTNGAQERNDNNQPVIADGIVAVHNGIITNDAELWQRHPELKREYEVDTEVLLRLVGKYRREAAAAEGAEPPGMAAKRVSAIGTVAPETAAANSAVAGVAPGSSRGVIAADSSRGVIAAVRAAFGEIEGYASVAMLFDDLDGLLLATNNGSLYAMRSRDDAGVFVFASEAYILRTLAGRRALRGLFDARDVERIQPGEGWWIQADDLGVERFSLRASEPRGVSEWKAGGACEAHRLEAGAGGEPQRHRDTERKGKHRLEAGATLETGATSSHPHPALSLQARGSPAEGGRATVAATCQIVDVSAQYNGEFARHRVRAYSPQIVTAQDDPSLLTRHLPYVQALKRCTRCVLPETYPYITFDENGVCNHCRHHRPIPTLGAEALREKIAPSRRGDGRPDCLVAVSGGRDSTFGLHYVKNVLGMNPIAYTYDWGMVTDLARRNISRICGRLGVEHLLVSADINRKRDNIRKNVLAWLRRPDLGVIPLFMAGDKTFFYYAKKVQKQTGVDLVIWCSGSGLESAHFKWLLGGVRRRVTDEGGQVDAARAARAFKLRLFAHYGRKFLANPAYLNSSIWDTLFGYYAYYLLPRDFVYLYNYLPWDEQEILDVLIGEYGWEVSPDTKQTWRIGDGTASFYNYIYHTAAGFCENDTFRSEQIRRGKLTRDEALALLEEENRPRYESIKWYLSIIGLGDRFNRIIETINAMPKRYAAVGAAIGA